MSGQRDVDLKVDWCSYKAAKYAVENWHYSGRMPMSKLLKLGVWEDGVFIGVVIFGNGATPFLLVRYNLSIQGGCELVRIALKKHRAPMSQIVKISIAMLKQQSPKLRLIISFADPGESHHGGIYQSGNWCYTGRSVGAYFFQDKKGKLWHPRNVSEDLSKSSKMISPLDCIKVWKEGKHRYLYPLDKAMRRQIEKLRQPYPKRAATGGTSTPIDAGGSIPTRPLQIAGQNVKVV